MIKLYPYRPEKYEERFGNREQEKSKASEITVLCNKITAASKNLQCNTISSCDHQEQIQKIQKEGAKSPTLPLHTSHPQNESFTFQNMQQYI